MGRWLHLVELVRVRLSGRSLAVGSVLLLACVLGVTGAVVAIGGHTRTLHRSASPVKTDVAGTTTTMPTSSEPISSAQTGVTTTTTTPPKGSGISAQVPTGSTSGAVRYSTKVDPTFTQSATDPYVVTYQYSADAIATTDNQSKDLGATGQLPAGVLNLYTPLSPGQSAGLACSMNVGGSVTGGPCTVTYQQFASYTITTQYIPNGFNPTTSSDQVAIRPFSFGSGSVAITETQQEGGSIGAAQAECRSAQQAGDPANGCTDHLTFTLTKATGPNGQSVTGGDLHVTWQGMTFTAPSGQDDCHINGYGQVAEDIGIQGQPTSADCSRAGIYDNTNWNDLSVSYTVTGYETPILTAAAQNCASGTTCDVTDGATAFRWSN